MSAEFLATVRKACLPGLWSKGVTLSREGGVFGLEEKGGEVTARVKAPGRAVPASVTLYLEDGEWACDCGGKLDPCEHVAGVAIAHSQGLGRGEPVRGVQAEPETGPRVVHAAGPKPGRQAEPGFVLREATPPPARSPARARGLRYRLRRKDGWLSLERFLVDGDEGGEVPLKTPLASLLARGEKVAAGQEDVFIDRLVSGKQFGFFPLASADAILRALASAEDVFFEDRKVRVSSEKLSPRARVVDAEKVDPRAPAGSVALVLEAPPELEAVVAPDLALADGELRPLGETDLTGSRLEKLPQRTVFPKDRLGELATRVLVDLEKRLEVEVKTKRLPRRDRSIRPRILFEVDQEALGIGVLPLLVYGDPPVARVEGDRIVHLGGAAPVRDEALEKKLLGRLRDELDMVPGRRVRHEGEAAVRFAMRLEAFEGRGGALERRGELSPKVALEGGEPGEGLGFSLDFELEDEDGETRRADPKAVLRAFRDGLPLAPLEGGGFAKIPSGFLEKFGDLLAGLFEAKDENGKLPRALAPALAELCDALERPKPPEVERLARLLDGGEGEVGGPPEDLEATLRDYQARGVFWLSRLRDARLGGVLADDMGLGKTLQALASLERGKRALVVCPRSVVFNWEAEIRRFRPALGVSLYHGPGRRLDPGAEITLTTYGVLRGDEDALSAVSWDAVVLDEAQAIKNPSSQTARAAFKLRAGFRLALSGTPVENRLEELWSLMHFACPGLLGGLSDFEARVARPVSAGDAEAAQRLRRRIRPFVLRRLKREVAPELPPRTEALLYCELAEEERAVYEAIRLATKKEVVAKLTSGGSVLAALEVLLRLRQAACHPGLLPGQRAESSSKVERLVEALEDASADGHKALVFSQWTSLLDLVEPHLRRAGVSFLRLDGSTRDRGAVVSAFQADAGPPVLLVSLKAGGTGLNLTAADHVFLLDPFWNPAAEDQASDRAHRIGQDKPVFVYRLVAKDTVEEGILALQAKKRALAGVALGEAGEAALSITREDLLELLA